MPISIREAFSQNMDIPVSISSKRLNHILQSTSLEEATSMGFIDLLFDRFFRNGGKREAITMLYQQVALPPDFQTFESEPTLKVALRFDMLRQLANEEYRNKFKTQINIDSESDEWLLSFEINHRLIFKSNWIKRADNEDCFQGLCALKITQDFENDLYACRSHLNNKDQLIRTRIQTMSDDKDVQSMLFSRLKDRAFAGSRLREVEDQGAGNCLVARFESIPEIHFSNRPGNNGEFRGDVLKKALLKKDYANLEELCSSDFMTEKDSRLIYIARIYKHESERLLVGSDFLDLNSYKFNTLKSMLSRRPVGETKTTICKLFDLEEPQHVHYLARKLLDEVS